MADYITFPEANLKLVAKPREGEVAEEDGSIIRDGVRISTLPVWHKNEREFISCWLLSPEEQQEVARTGKIWCHVLGALDPPSHPPIFVSGAHPSGDPAYCEPDEPDELTEEDDEPSYHALGRDE